MKVKKLIPPLILFLIASPIPSIAQKTMEQRIDSFFKPLVDFLSQIIFFKPLEFIDIHMPIVVIWLIFGATYFTFYFRFINIRLFKHAIDVVRGVYDDKKDKGEVSHFQALVTALSGTVGLGNIAGVAVAISTGGPGATFWMIVAGLLGMTSKFVECTLGVKYRVLDREGAVSGGPMYYLSSGLEKYNKKRLGVFLSGLFSILCIGGSIGAGNMFQANQSYAQFINVFPQAEGNAIWFGCLMAIMVGVVIIGGIKKIANVTDKIVPIMVGVYLLTGLFIIFSNTHLMSTAFSKIIEGAFTKSALFGGAMGSLIVGFKRAAFSNEAGVGSASIAHAAVKTDEPLTEGIVGLLEPFIDTVCICTMTALILIFTGADDPRLNLNGAALTSYAFSSVVPWFKYILTISILLFAFSTMISWSYYGLKSWTFLFGHSKKSELTFKMLFLLAIIVGASSQLGSVMDFSDMMILSMSVPNIMGLYILAPEIKKDLNIYLDKLKNGKL